MLFQVWINNRWNPLHVGAMFGYVLSLTVQWLGEGYEKLLLLLSIFIISEWTDSDVCHNKNYGFFLCS